MSVASSSEDEWFSLLEPSPQARYEPAGSPDDPRLGEIIEVWRGDPKVIENGRPVLVGFPQDEGVRRNRGRPGAALAPDQIRFWLGKLTPVDPGNDMDLRENPPLDLGNLRIGGSLEETQENLAKVIAGILQWACLPIVLGGGHETAFGHFLGYRKASRKVGIINIDAHLDVRPLTLLSSQEGEGAVRGLGHSGSPFRQALEYAADPLPGDNYVCLGAQPFCVSRDHFDFVKNHHGRVYWCDQVHGHLCQIFSDEVARLEKSGCQVYFTIDADAVSNTDVPGVSAPNPLGLEGAEVLSCIRLAARSPAVASLDLVEINPLFDRDHQSVRWAALAIWQFLMGRGERARP